MTGKQPTEKSTKYFAAAENFAVVWYFCVSPTRSEEGGGVWHPAGGLDPGPRAVSTTHTHMHTFLTPTRSGPTN